ncbi:hypothetical protein FVB9288_01330 [Flavobacterium sp. CECT 9288]|uniref:hypothetical protein n=1 Tax=Flavobacterium sp. CECT 9288 TaxID=2845819 RepID=UPI001E60825E|nr:hypothetical protein [Flavobacterium sp. CECT 9288]CAH0335678.1 hypothetical protein FVB9288_01330 [Flavobacterium sp. CECT 9288]
MKTIKLIVAGIILLVSSSIQAQISVNVNIGRAPSWGHVGNVNAEYYYLPDVEAYYDVRATRFIYFDHGRWIRARFLPNQYRNYNLNTGCKVVLNDYHGPSPYNHFRTHRVKYYRGYRGNEPRNVVYHVDRRVYLNERPSNPGDHRNRRDNDRHDDRKYYKNKRHDRDDDRGRDRD